MGWSLFLRERRTWEGTVCPSCQVMVMQHRSRDGHLISDLSPAQKTGGFSTLQRLARRVGSAKLWAVSAHSHSQTSPLCLGPPSAPAPMLATCLYGMAGAGSDLKDASGSSGLFCKGLHWFIETSTGCVCLRGGAEDGGEQLDGPRCPAPEPQLSPKTLGRPLLAERYCPAGLCSW